MMQKKVMKIMNLDWVKLFKQKGRQMQLLAESHKPHKIQDAAWARDGKGCSLITVLHFELSIRMLKKNIKHQS